MAEPVRRRPVRDPEAGADDLDVPYSPEPGGGSSKGGASSASSSVRALYTEMTVALGVSAVISLVPGVVLSVYADTLLAVPGLLALVPPLIGMRGNVFGSLSSKLSTLVAAMPAAGAADLRALDAVHARPDMRARYHGALAEVLFLSLVLPVFSALLRAATGEPLADLSVSTLICVLSGLLSGSVMLGFTQWVVLAAVRRGLDPDNVSAPLITTLGDLITIPCVLVAQYAALAMPGSLRVALILAMAVGCGYLFALAAGLISRAAFRTLLIERIPVLIVCMTVSFLAGIALELLMDKLGAGPTPTPARAAANAVLVALSPVFNAQGGSGGGVFASRISTYCALAKGSGAGSDEQPPSLPWRPPRSMQVEAAVLAAAIATILAGLGVVLVVGYGFGVGVVVALAVGMTGLLSSAAAVAYAATKVCLDQRWEADNIGIPVVCATMDFVASWGYVAILLAVYV